MASAQNFFNPTPAPDPQQNPIMAGLAGGLQGASNQGDYQKQMAMQMWMNNQKQNTDTIQAGVQNHQAGYGQGPAGSTPIQIGGQPGYWDSNGESPLNSAKINWYNSKSDSVDPNAQADKFTYQAQLKGIQSAMGQDTNLFGKTDEIDPDTGKPFKNRSAAYASLMKQTMLDYAAKQQPQDQGQSDQTQPWQPGQPKSEGQPGAGQDAAKSLFSPKSTPRSKVLTANLAQSYYDKTPKNLSHPQRLQMAKTNASKDGYVSGEQQVQ